MTIPDLDVRRRRAKFRAWHRGTREMDLLLGRFCDAEIGALPEADVADLEALLEAQDRDVYAWLSGEIAVPGDYDTPVFRKVLAFHAHTAPLFR